VGRALLRLQGDRIPFAPVFEHGDALVGLYTPREKDLQQPHDQDEVYVVVQGTGHFRNGSHRHAFAAGDVMYVSAFEEHRFEDFSDDLQVWVVFFGPHEDKPA
jgi:mannose-6-phosphate isomerase-like protein (cupin superfamily)